MAPPVDPRALATGTALSLDAAGPRVLGSAQAGRSRSGTRIMPHGVTALPDPGRATEPIEEPSPSWQRRSRRPFFALPSLLLLVLVVCFGMSELGSHGAAAGPVPTIRPAQPGLIAEPPSATPSAAPPEGPTSASNGVGHGKGEHKGAGHDSGAGHGKGGGKHAGKHAGKHPGKGTIAASHPVSDSTTHLAKADLPGLIARG
jgi:hypothetical protein